jgi:Fe2+ or Zn2+ uptake regulation protein
VKRIAAVWFQNILMFNVADMFLSTTQKLIADMSLSTIVYQTVEQLQEQFVIHIANMCHNTTGNTHVAKILANNHAHKVINITGRCMTSEPL